jgi:hypothetical protein
MVDPLFVTFIRNRISSGTDKDVVRGELATAGYSSQQIEELFSHIDVQADEPVLREPETTPPPPPPGEIYEPPATSDASVPRPTSPFAAYVTERRRGRPKRRSRHIFAYLLFILFVLAAIPGTLYLFAYEQHIDIQTLLQPIMPQLQPFITLFENFRNRF